MTKILKVKEFHINQKKTFIYNEETFYEQKNEIETFNELNTTIETVLLYDDEIFIFVVLPIYYKSIC